MKIATWAKLWFGGLLALGGEQLLHERARLREERSKFHGYPWEQVNDVINMCYAARPDVRDQFSLMSQEDRVRSVGALFTCSPATFKNVFGFDRPPPRA